MKFPWATNLLVASPTKKIAEEAHDIIWEFLTQRGLELSLEKIKITHIDDGFDFLG